LDACIQICIQGLKQMVGAVRFELTTSCTRNKRASQATLRPDVCPPLPLAGHPREARKTGNPESLADSRAPWQRVLN
jgi:hypothetical protein